jgi:D-serine deaminase-like pyridoxal phosphate-dependent protein
LDKAKDMLIEDLMTPALLVDKVRLENNIKTMAEKAKKYDVSLRPHIKTHKCVEIGKMQLDHGASGITTATLGEALVFANEGFDDITIAFPVAIDKIPAIVDLASQITLNVLVDHTSLVEHLNSGAKEKQSKLNVLMKVDCGYHRCGVDPENPAALKLAKKIANSPHLEFTGILTHGGHSYNAHSVDEIKKVAFQEQDVLAKFANALKNESESMEPKIVSVGSTPTMMLCDSIRDEITEIRPGNYVFFDYTQVTLGVCKLEDCAQTVLSSIVGVYNDHIVIDAGALALSKDLGSTHIKPDSGYGRILRDYDASIEYTDYKIKSISQEHGKISVGSSSELRDLTHGDRLRIVSNHSCLTQYMYDKLFLVEKEKVVDTWRIHQDRISV